MNKSSIPMHHGVGASQIVLPAGGYLTVYDFLCHYFSHISADIWQQRMVAGLVLDESAQPVGCNQPYQVGRVIYYYRAIENEPIIPFKTGILYEDDRIIVADKPHFLPVIPSGQFVQHTLLTQLREITNIQDLVPVHRIDRETAGLVLLCKRAADRAAYTQLFARQLITKQYEAIAHICADTQFPEQISARMVHGEPFYRMHIVPGAVNSCTRIHLLETFVLGQSNAGFGKFLLQPITGKQHQLRVHMASLGAPIMGDALYPVDEQRSRYDFSQPLQLLAKSLTFSDPFTGQTHDFTSCLKLRYGDVY